MLAAATRRQHPIVQELVQTIGSSMALYNELLRMLRQQYLAHGTRLLGALRADVLMTFHDANNVDVRGKADVRH